MQGTINIFRAPVHIVQRSVLSSEKADGDKDVEPHFLPSADPLDSRWPQKSSMGGRKETSCSGVSVSLHSRSRGMPSGT